MVVSGDHQSVFSVPDFGGGDGVDPAGLRLTPGTDDGSEVGVLGDDDAAPAEARRFIDEARDRLDPAQQRSLAAQGDQRRMALLSLRRLTPPGWGIPCSQGCLLEIGGARS